MSEEQQTNQRKYYFMSGLPRSGSTLLSAILNQNPKFHSGPSSPVVGIMLMLEEHIARDELFLAYPKPMQAGQIIANVLTHYYSDINKPVIFDKNRSWVNRLHYINGYFGLAPKVLCPVRDIDEIFTSFLLMHRRNPFQVNGKVNFLDEMLIKSNIPLTDDNRCEFLASEMGILGQSYRGLQKAVMEGRQNQLHFIEYRDLTSEPKEVMRAVYDFLDEEYFEHDFSNIQNIHKENDASVYGFADMHDVRPTVEQTSPDPSAILSEQTLSRCANTAFWRELDPIDFDNLPGTSSEQSNANFFAGSEEETEPTNSNLIL